MIVEAVVEALEEEAVEALEPVGEAVEVVPPAVVSEEAVEALEPAGEELEEVVEVLDALFCIQMYLHYPRCAAW